MEVRKETKKEVGSCCFCTDNRYLKVWVIKTGSWVFRICSDCLEELNEKTK